MEKKFSYDNVSGLHLELTTKCNAMCPMCNRNFKGKIRESLPLLELSISDVKKMLTPNFLKQLKLISLCGVYGEPICNKDLKEILKYFYSCNPLIDIDIYTNGGLYNIDWWEDLANIMKGYNGTVIFGIDGMKDTNSLHRCNVDFDKVIENASAFIKNGGNAQWDYIVFKHNQCQVQEAKKLSEELGFKIFQIKKTSRFLKNLYECDKNLDSTILEYGKHPVYNSKGEIIYFIEPPTILEYRNSSELKFNNIINNYGDFLSYLNNNKISCESIKNGGIFISASGEVFPCCTVYQQVCYKLFHNVEDINELNEYNLYLKYNLSCIDNDIEDIVNGDFFSELYRSFKYKSIEEGKPKSCSRACGKDLNVHLDGHTTKVKYKRK